LHSTKGRVGIARIIGSASLHRSRGPEHTITPPPGRRREPERDRGRNQAPARKPKGRRALGQEELPDSDREHAARKSHEETHPSSSSCKIKAQGSNARQATATSPDRGGLDPRSKALKPDPPKGRSTARRKEPSKEGRLLARKTLRRAEALVGMARGMEPEREPDQRPETRRSPGSAAGRNKPARQSAEKAIKTVRNREGGTGLDPWQGQAEAKTPKVGNHRRSRAGVDASCPCRWSGDL